MPKIFKNAIFNTAIFNRELKSYFKSPIAYFFIFGALLLNILLIIEIGQIFKIGKADISVVFSFYPWIMAFFIPAAFMRVWSEEFKTKTFDNLIILPIDLKAIIGAKFTSGLLIILFMVLAILPFLIYLKFLGPIDLGQIILSLLASFLLGAAFLGIIFFTSSLSDKQTIAYLFALLINIGLLLLGYGINYGLSERFSLLAQFNNFNIGLINIGAALFILIAFFALILNYLVLKNRINKNYKSKNAYALILVCFVLYSFIPNTYLSLGFGQNANLKPLTKSVIEEIKTPISLELYYSNELIHNPELNALKTRIIAKLNQYKALSKGKIIIEEKPFKAFSDLEDIAINSGLIPLNNNGENLYFGLIIKSKEKIANIPYLSEQTEPRFEYFLTRAINTLSKPKPKTAIISELPNIFENSNIASELRAQQDVINLPPEFVSLPLGLDGLIIANPYKLSNTQIQAIKNYKNSGCKVMFAIDPLPLMTGKPYDMSNLGGLLNEFGFVVSGDIIADKDNAIIIAANNNEKAIDLPQPLFANINGVNFIDFGAIDINQDKKSNIKIIAETSNNTQKLSALFAAKEPSPQEVMAEGEFENIKHIIAARIDKNTSVFADTDFLYDDFYIVNNIIGAKNADLFMNEFEALLGKTNYAELRDIKIESNNFYYMDEVNASENSELLANQGILTEDIKNLEAELINANAENSKKIRSEILNKRAALLEIASIAENKIGHIKLWGYVWGLALPFLILLLAHRRINKNI